MISIDIKEFKAASIFFSPCLTDKNSVQIRQCELSDARQPCLDREAGWKSGRELSVLLDFGCDCYVDKIQLCDVNGGCALFTAPFVALHGTVDGKMRMLDCQNNCNELQSSLTFKVGIKTRLIQISFWHTNHSIGKFMPFPKLMVSGNADSMPGKPITPEEALEITSKGSICVDEYGQCVALEWQGKIHSDDDFKQAYQSEKSRYFNLPEIPNGLDKFYGSPQKLSRKGTGFFTVGKEDGKWWFFTPEGNPFLMKGVDLLCYDESSCYTPVYEKNRKEVRRIFEGLPDCNKYADAYKTYGDHVKVVDFLQANLMRKYGEDYDDQWAQMTKKRLDSWNFNCSAKWLMNPRFQKYPYVYSLGLDQSYRMIEWTVDPFDSAFEQKVKNNVRRELEVHRDDPYLIGYHFGNESGWDREILGKVLSDTSGLPAKKAFVQYMVKCCGGIGALCRMISAETQNEEQLCEISISSECIPDALLFDFIRLASKTYFSKVNSALKSIDPNHLFLGSALTPDWRSCIEWEIGGAEYTDVISLDYYTDDAGFLNRYRIVDKPLLNLEFSFTTGERGHRAIFDSISRMTEHERGLAYQDFVKKMCSFPSFVGFGFFILHDQPVSGRADYDGSAGEAYQFGLVDIQDNIYQEFCSLVAEANSGLEELHRSISV